MEAKDKKIIELISQKSATFVIPTYQRKYKWSIVKNQEVDTLIKDIDQFLKNDELDSYFLGSIVVKKNSNLNANYILVDGQQRITTMFLLCRALYDVLGDGSLKNRVYLNLETEEDKFKLKRINDEIIVKKILQGDLTSITSGDEKSNYFKVYDFFIKHFKGKTQEQLDRFYNNGIVNLKIALINLNEKEDEFLVFESINSKGSPLSSADLIKNYIMMALDYKNLDSSINKFENDFVEQLEEKELLDFFRQFLAVKTGNLFSKSNKSLYYKFKDNYKKEDIDEEFIYYLINQLNIFNYIKSYKGHYKMIPLIRGGLLNVYSILHVIVENYSLWENNELKITNEKTIEKYFGYFARLLVARMLYGFGRVEGNRGYALMAKKLSDAIQFESFEDSFEKVVVSYLETTDRKTRMPSWNEIEGEIFKTDIYSNYSALLKWAMIALEQINANKEIDQSKLSVEHIYPQNPHTDWSDELTYEERIKNMKYLNTLGNLSITNENSAMGNKSFEKKRKILEERSYLKINKSIYKVDRWNEEAIQERALSLLKNIKSIWWA